MKLIVVESPTKAKTLARFLEGNFVVKATMGHVVDLPEDEMGVDVSSFHMDFRIIRGKERIIKELKDFTKRSEIVYISTDPDREGEAIAYHVLRLTKPKNYRRIELHAIVKDELIKALNNPRDIDIHRVNAQFARRFIDRIVGYLLSPLASKSLGGRLSVGRVQSPALRLIVEREREIRNFTPRKYYQIAVLYEKLGLSFKAKYKHNLESKEEALSIYESISSARHVVSDILRKEVHEKPPEPYRTSTLQQDASKLLGFSPERTMRIAQRLYEQGYITYHRTDSPRLSEQAVKMIRDFIGTNFGKEYLPKKPRIYKAKGMVQDAHEAIRPTNMELTPQQVELDEQSRKLYDLIWKRSLACQMASAIWEDVHVILKANGYELHAKGKSIVFDGWRKIYGYDEEVLPELEIGEELEAKDVQLLEKETQPPPRYTESTLIRTLEKLGIGRPSTYAVIVSTLKKRGYVVVKGRTFYPTQKGEKLVDWLHENYAWVLDYKLTANMESKLDKVEEGDLDWKDVVLEIYRLLEDVESKIKDNRPSTKQLEFAKELSRKLRLKIPDEALLDRRKLSRWIDKHKPPTQKQVEFAKHIAQSIGKEIPEDVLNNQKKLSKWLDNNIPPTSKQLELLRKLEQEGKTIPKKAYESKKEAKRVIRKLLGNANKKR